MTELAHRKVSNNALLADFANLNHDAVGNRLSLSASLPLSPTSYSGTTTYGYDNKDQLTQETSTRAGGYSNGYGYDLVGNPTTWKGVAQTFNSVNQNTQGGTVTFDSNGNPQSWSGATLSYDANDKLVSIGSVLSAGYGRDGLRAWKQSSSGRTYFLYDGLVPVCELDGSGNVTAVDTVGATGVLARHVNGTGGGSVFYAFDPQGSVSVRLDTSGNVLSSHVNEAWGTQVSSGTGYANDPYAGYGGQWGYYRDAETGLHLLGHRYYDAARGRFINRDPIGYEGGINLYAYCDNNPMEGADPSGYLEGCLLAAGGATVGGGSITVGNPISAIVTGGAALVDLGIWGATGGRVTAGPFTSKGHDLGMRYFGPEVPTPESEEANQPTFPTNGRKPKPKNPTLPGLEDDCPPAEPETPEPEKQPEPAKSRDSRDDENDCAREVLKKHPVIRSSNEWFRLMRECMEGKDYKYINGRWVKK